jgi:hypothetical protein
VDISSNVQIVDFALVFDAQNTVEEVVRVEVSFVRLLDTDLQSNFVV